MRVLLIENDQTIAGAISRAIGRIGVRCEQQSQENVETLIAERDGSLENYDAILVGNASGGDIFIASLRAKVGPAIIVSLLDHRCVNSTIQHLRAGADDVLVKPINPQEIEARLHAVRRRTHGHSSPELTVGRLTIFLDGRDPAVDGQRLRLSHREHAIFSVLALNVGRVVSKEKIYETVYTLSGSDPLDKVIDVYICKLRKKIAEATGGDKYIETVYGRGYKFEAPPDEDRDAGEPAPLKPARPPLPALIKTSPAVCARA